MKRFLGFLRHEFLYMLILVLGIIYVFYGFIGMDNPPSKLVTLNQLNFQGTVSIDGEDPIAVSTIENLENLSGTEMVLEGRFDKEIVDTTKVFMKLEELNCNVYLNHNLIYTNHYPEAELWGSFILYRLTDSDTLRIELSSQDEHSSNSMGHVLTSFCSGDESELLNYQMHKYAASIGVSLVIFIFGIAVLVVALILWILNFKNVKEYFVCGLLAVSGSMCCLLNYDYIQLWIPWINGLMAMDFFFQMLLSCSLLVYLNCYIREKRSYRISKIMSYIWIFLVIINVCYTLIIGKHKPVAYGWMMAVLILMVALELVFIIKEYTRTENRDVQGVFLGSAVMAVATMIEVVHYLWKEFWLYYPIELGLAVFTSMQLMILINISRRGLRQAMRVKEMENELMEANINTMMSQIQPHFLYNSLGAIRALVQINPDKAVDVLDHFSRYLRTNMQSLTQHTMIPFSQELDHVENYLYIEEVRFLDKLHVEYDIETEDFECPGLVLQTTVENAVKHGIGNKKGGGTIWIRSHEEKNAYVVIVEDDGVGFDPDQVVEDGRVHIGIENSRSRLAGMCKGTYQVESKLGEGTRVTITIPKKDENYQQYETLC